MHTTQNDTYLTWGRIFLKHIQGFSCFTFLLNEPILKALGMEAQSIVSDGRRARKNDDNNYGNKDDSGDDCDGDGSSDDGDGSSDDDVTDQICALCDDGGHLLR